MRGTVTKKKRDMALVVNDAVIIAQRQNLEAAMSTNPKVKELIRANIRHELAIARKQLMSQVPFKSDPRGTARAIRTSVYKKILGGNINILQSRKAHGGTNGYEPPRKLVPGQRGGNRMARSPRTKQIQQYPPLDRGFILRFVNSGTDDRYAGHGRMPKSKSQYDREGWIMKYGGRGFRGSIAGRNWFANAAENELAGAANNLANIIAEETAKIIGNN